MLILEKLLPDIIELEPLFSQLEQLTGKMPECTIGFDLFIAPAELMAPAKMWLVS